MEIEFQWIDWKFDMLQIFILLKSFHRHDLLSWGRLTSTRRHFSKRLILQYFIFNEYAFLHYFYMYIFK